MIYDEDPRIDHFKPWDIDEDPLAYGCDVCGETPSEIAVVFTPSDLLNHEVQLCSTHGEGKGFDETIKAMGEKKSYGRPSWVPAALQPVCEREYVDPDK